MPSGTPGELPKSRVEGLATLIDGLLLGLSVQARDGVPLMSIHAAIDTVWGRDAGRAKDHVKAEAGRPSDSGWMDVKRAGYINGYTEECSHQKMTLLQMDRRNFDSVSGHHFSVRSGSLSSALVRRLLRTLGRSGLERVLALATVRGHSREAGFFRYTVGTVLGSADRSRPRQPCVRSRQS